MKKMLALCAALFVGHAAAGSIINKDSVKYDLEINGNSTYIEHNTTGCGFSKGATIKIKGTSQSIKVETDTDVIIENGKLKLK